MAENDKEPPPMPADTLPDAPRGFALAVTSRADAFALARRMAGEVPPDEMRFRCITCGWDKTLKFEADEIEALGGDIKSYGGPCGGCQSMTLVPFSSLFGDSFKPILERDKEQRHKEYKEQAVVQAETLVETIKKNIIGGSVLDGGMTDPGVPEEPAEEVSADDTEGLTPRKG